MGSTGSKVLSVRRSSQSIAPRDLLPSHGSMRSVESGGEASPDSPRSEGDSPARAVSSSEAEDRGELLPGSLRKRHSGNTPPMSKVSGREADTQEFGPNGGGSGQQKEWSDEETLRVGCGPAMPTTWQRGDAIGTGSFGVVVLGLNNTTGELLAVKEVPVNADARKMKEAVEQLEREVKLLSTLNHPNIVKYVGTKCESKRLLIFLEYVPGGSIATLLQRFGALEESVIRIYTRQILKGLAYLHAQRTVHRDIKGANLLVEKNGRIKLADFGMAKQMVEHMSTTRSFKGSASWMAPEVIRQRGHGVPADIWSVGCTVLEMAVGKPPWYECDSQIQVIFKIAESSAPPTIPDSLSPAAADFILLCLQRDPAARPTADELLAHPFVALQPGEEEHPTYFASDEYCFAPPGSATIPAAHSKQPNSRRCMPSGRLPNVAEGNEDDALRSAFSYSGSGRAKSSSTDKPRAATSSARKHVDSSRERMPSPSATTPPPDASSKVSTGAGRPPAGPTGVLSPGTPAGTVPKTRKKKKHSKSRHSQGGSTSGDDKSSLPTPTQLTEEVDGGQTTTPRTPVGEDDQDFASQPHQFRVKGLLGLPPLKMHANTGDAHLTLPPLDYRPDSAVITPSKAPVPS